MGECPFCKKGISDDLDRWGGACPHCGTEICGEEAATDAGQGPTRSLWPFFATMGVTLTVGAVIALSQPAPKKVNHRDAVTWAPVKTAQVEAIAPETEASPSEEEGGLLSQIKGLSGGSTEEGGLLSQIKGLSGKVINQGDDEAEPTPEPLPDTPSARTLAQADAATKTTAATVKRTSPSRAATGNIAVIERPKLSSLKEGIQVARQWASLKQRVLDNATEINDMVRHIMATEQNKLRQCYESRIKSEEGLRGRWLVGFEITTTGAPAGVEVRALDQGDAELESCIERKVSQWAFLRIDEPMQVEKVIQFGPGR